MNEPNENKMTETKRIPAVGDATESENTAAPETPRPRRRRSERYAGAASDGETPAAPVTAGTEETAPAAATYAGPVSRFERPAEKPAGETGIEPEAGAVTEEPGDSANKAGSGEETGAPAAYAGQGLDRGSRLPPQATRMNSVSRLRIGNDGNAAAGTNRPVRPPVTQRGRMTEINPAERRAAAGNQPRRPEYPERRGQTENTYPSRDGQRKQYPPVNPSRKPAGKEPKSGKGKKILIILLVLLVLAGAVFAGVKFLLPMFRGTDGGAQTGETATPPVANGVTVSAKASGNLDSVAPSDVIFTVTTSSNVTDVRLVNEAGEVLPTSQQGANNADRNIRTLTWRAADAYRGNVRVQVMTDTEWLDTDQVIPVEILSLSELTTESPAPETESVVVYEPTAEPTEAPTPEPAEETAEVQNEEPEARGEEDPWAGEPTEEDFRGETEEAEPVWEYTGVGETEGEEAGEDAAFADETVTDGEDPDMPEETETDGEDPDMPSETAEETEDGSEVTASEENSGAENAGEKTAEAAPVEVKKLVVEATEETDPAALIKEAVIYEGTKKVKEYTRPARELITMPVGGEYTKQPMGVLTYRGDAFRQNPALGTVTEASSLELMWSSETGSAKSSSKTVYYGVGWTGQPAIVKWSKQVREASNMYDGKKEKSGLREVIVAGMDGNIYFLDLMDGTATRNSIKVGYPMRGTPSLHPSGYPYMNVGQYARKMAKGTGKIGLRQFNLYTGKEMSLIDGLDGTNRRPYNDVGSFETSALIDRTSDTLITAGTNGMLYVIRMDSAFDYAIGSYAQNATATSLKVQVKGEKKADVAVEASVAMYDRYVFYADMAGYLRCVDTNTMTTLWMVNTEDSVESTPALELTGGEILDLYTANELNKRGKGTAQIRKINALTGEELWIREIPVQKNKKTNEVIGFRASPVVGQGNLSSLVFYTVNGLSAEGAGVLGLPDDAKAALMALDKENGRVVWARELGGTAYSSPVAVYDENGNGKIIQCEADGTIYMLEGTDGGEVASLTVEGSIEASPAVYNDMMVICTSEKGKNFIYGIRIQ